MKTHSGFTIMEMMIAVSVAAILLAIGVPGMQDFVRNNRRAAEVNNVIASLQIARSEAVARNRRVGICASTNMTACAGSTTWENGWIVFVDNDRDGDRDNDEDILRAEPGMQNITLRAGFQSLVYLSNGRIQVFPSGDSEGELTLCDSRGASEARVLQVPESGRPATSTTTLADASPSCP